MKVESDRRFDFDLAPTDLWAVLTRLEEFQTWWPWLRHFEGNTLAAGERWTCEVQPPLPYKVRFVLELEEVEAERGAIASVSGDVVGNATIALRATDTGSELRLVSRLAPASRLLRSVSWAAKPIARFGHDWVLDSGLRQFQKRAL